MRKRRIILIGLLLVLIVMGFSLNTIAQNNSEKEKEIPEILQLNPSLDFDKEAIKEWAKEHSWEEAYGSAIKANTRRSRGPGKIYAYVTFGTPVYLWTQAYSNISWGEEKKKEEYRNGLVKPKEGAGFICIMYATDKEKLKQNIRWFLEVDDRFWKANHVEEGEIETGKAMYNNFYFILFDFRDMGGHPKWTKWTLYLVREDLMEDFVWDFE